VQQVEDKLVAHLVSRVEIGKLAKL
jgi:hypothetical protein